MAAKRHNYLEFKKSRDRLFLVFAALLTCVLFLFIFGYRTTFPYNLPAVHLPVSDSYLDFYKMNTSSQQFICPHWSGRLGNLMFQYASLYTIARKKGLLLVITKSDKIYQVFNLKKFIQPVSGYAKKKICSKVKILKLMRSRYYENLTIPASQNVKIVGYLQSWKYFESLEFEIREQFVFKFHIRQKAEGVLKDAIKKMFGRGTDVSHVTSIGVHIRRGDFIKLNLTVANKNYLQKASDFFRKLYSKVIFLVSTTSDKESQDWTLRSFVKLYSYDTLLVGTTGTESPEVDMALLSLCNHTIITVGSYGWWVGWFNNGTTVYYDYITDDGRIRKEDYIYPGWIGIKK